MVAASKSSAPGVQQQRRKGPERSLRLEHPASTAGRQMPLLMESTKVTSWKQGGRNDRNQKLREREKGRRCGGYGSRNRCQEECVQEAAANDNIFF